MFVRCWRPGLGSTFEFYVFIPEPTRPMVERDVALIEVPEPPPRGTKTANAPQGGGPRRAVRVRLRGFGSSPQTLLPWS